MKIEVDFFVDFLSKLPVSHKSNVLFDFKDEGLEIRSAEDTNINFIAFISKKFFENYKPTSFIVPDLNFIVNILKNFKGKKVEIIFGENAFVLKVSFLLITIPYFDKKFFKVFKELQKEPLSIISLRSDDLKVLLKLFKIVSADEVSLTIQDNRLIFGFGSIEKIEANIETEWAGVDILMTFPLKTLNQVLAGVEDKCFLVFYDNFVEFRCLMQDAYRRYFIFALSKKIKEVELPKTEVKQKQDVFFGEEEKEEEIERKEEERTTIISEEEDIW